MYSLRPNCITLGLNDTNRCEGYFGEYKKKVKREYTITDELYEMEEFIEAKRKIVNLKIKLEFSKIEFEFIDHELFPLREIITGYAFNILVSINSIKTRI